MKNVDHKYKDLAGAILKVDRVGYVNWVNGFIISSAAKVSVYNITKSVYEDIQKHLDSELEVVEILEDFIAEDSEHIKMFDKDCVICRKQDDTKIAILVATTKIAIDKNIIKIIKPGVEEVGVKGHRRHNYGRSAYEWL